MVKETRVEYQHEALRKLLRSTKAGQELGFFLHRNIPLGWMERLCRLNYGALKVGLALIYLGVVSRSQEVMLTRSVCEKFHISPSQKSRAMKRLLQEGLIHYTPRPRGNPGVTLLTK